MKSVTRIELLFGLGRADGGTIAESAWAVFVDRALNPAFPAGFTVTEARGQWRNAAGVYIAETAKVVMVIAQPGADLSEPVARVVEAYKREFAQEAVGVVRTSACAAF